MVSGLNDTSAALTAMPEPAQQSMARMIAIYGKTFFITRRKGTTFSPHLQMLLFLYAFVR